MCVAAFAAATPRGPACRRSTRVLRCRASATPRVVLVPTERCKTVRETQEVSATTFVLGSGAAAHVRVQNDPNVAPEHTRFDWRGGRLYITDLGGGAGTYFDGTRLQSGVAYVAGQSTVLGVGDPPATELRVELPSGGASPQGDTSMDKMLADAFLQRFRTQGSAEVQALLRENDTS